MKLTSKGRFAVMSLVDIAINSVANKPVSLSDISSRQNTNKYREDQKEWIKRWFRQYQNKVYKCVWLSWINLNKKIGIIYFPHFTTVRLSCERMNLVHFLILLHYGSSHDCQ